ncbi:putative HVA22-like protein g [Phoenix dactylifera]|uniref:HVA22-like protein n=1 Tax=Phoenix dactylifera TaxID=42345 RepID=A0A8B9B0G3_PHODC|nr:putative HVA22-like protein g [Phoenix dactylifera]
MLGDLAITVLVMLFGYAYPALECFKTLEQRQWPGEIEQLRFWCQYWVIVAIVTTVGDSLISWLPMYGEAKLAFFVYLWYPKTKGSDLIYETFLRPLVMQYEPDIEQRLRHLRAKSGELLVFYLKNFTDKGTTLFLEVLNYVVSSTKGNQRSSRWNPLTAIRSFRQAPAMEVGIHEEPEPPYNPRAEYLRSRHR